ncbi:VOC family protein [Kribbella antiqua]|uniref:VOC family protein n=1 Tax=Kribbella antiqua TaxID=2512217 RepID=UPI001F54566B|nr:VOC family protein [Kribbella antiqua]
MACRISELVPGCRDPELLRRFWCEVLDFVVLDREDDGSLEIGPREGFGGPQPTIILSRRDEPEKGNSRLHIDVNATDRDQDAELERLLELGARPADIGQTGDEPWHVLGDPEGTRSASSGPASPHSDAHRPRLGTSHLGLPRSPVRRRVVMVKSVRPRSRVHRPGRT